MNILLDSNVLIDLIKGKVTLDTDCKYFINPIVYSEVLYGLLHLKKPEKALVTFLEEKRIEILAMGRDTGSIHSRIKLDLNTKGFPVPDNDLLVASSCIEYDLTLFTFNIKHFNKIPNLALYKLK